ncbi:MAG TPA: hypothetical protein VG222_01405 [Vicinamibacterales bacterium]|jgi:hypothetical protein|nr:hypothetical protein [Vicinamibacterales bacterium]
MVVRTSDGLVDVMRIRLVRKLADYLDGIDVSRYHEGDVVDLPRAEAELLIAEQWALPFSGPSRDVRAVSTGQRRAFAADRSQRRTLEQLRRVREGLESKPFEPYELRRAEDHIREAHHDSRPKTLKDKE